MFTDLSMLGYHAMKLQYVCHCHLNINITELLVCWKDVPGDSDEFDCQVRLLAQSNMNKALVLFSPPDCCSQNY